MENIQIKEYAEKSGDVINRSISQVFPALKSSGMSFTKRESECFYLLSRFTTVKKIANVLGLSPRTVEMHINNLKNKTGVCYKAELIEKAIYWFHVSQHMSNFKSQSL